MKVLFATDGHKAANDAERLLEALGDREHISVTALSVLQSDILIPHPERGFMHRTLLERQKLTQQLAQGAAGRLSDAGFQTDERMREGNPGEEIVRSTDEGGFELTVVGAGSHNWLSHVLLGSTSTHLLHRSPTSVLIVHQFRRNPSERVQILFGTDGSEGSSVALQTLMDFADAARCQVRVTAVVAPLPVSAVPPPHEASYLKALAGYEKQRDQALHEEAKGHVRAAVARLESNGFDASSSILSGHPSEQLLKTAEAGDFDLVALGSRGLGRMKRAFLGSVSDHIARLSRSALVGRGNVSVEMPPQ